MYQIHYESNIKANISNTIDNFDGGVLGYHFRLSFRKKKKKMFCIEIISLCVFSFILDHFPNISKSPKGSLTQLVDNKNISY